MLPARLMVCPSMNRETLLRLAFAAEGGKARRDREAEEETVSDD